jgi:hypothetical protein
MQLGNDEGDYYRGTFTPRDRHDGPSTVGEDR